MLTVTAAFLLACLAVAGTAHASADPPAYLGQQSRLTFDGFALADRANLAVNVVNGNLVVTGNDVRIAGRGLSLAVSRSYNARGSGARGSFGLNWVSSLGADSTLKVESDGDRTWRGPTGQELRFDKQADGSFVSPAGANATLVLNVGGTATLTQNRSETKYAYDASSPQKLTKVTDRNGNHLDLTYGASGVSKIADTQGRDLTFGYNAAGDLTSLTDASARVWGYGYDASHRLTSYTDPESKQWIYHYDGSGRLDKITDPRSQDTTIGYDSSDRVTAVTRVVDGTVANDVKTTYAYAAASSPCAVTLFGKTTLTDPRGKTTVYCGDSNRQVTKAQNALAEDEDRQYTPNGDVSLYTAQAQAGATSGATALSFETTGTNPTNNLTGGTAATGEAFSIGYNATLTGSKYRPRSYTDEQAADTLFGYDTAGNVTTVKDSDTTTRNKAVLTYNADGTIASATDGELHQTTFAYFADGNLKQINPPAPMGSTSYTYDALSRVATIAWPNGETATYGYDKLDRVKRIDFGTAPDPHFYTFGYDADGNLSQRVDDNADGPRTTTWSYDKLNRRSQDSLPEGYLFSYGYDKASNFASITGSGGVVGDTAYGTVSYSYDDINRVSTIVSPNAAGTSTDTIGYAYQDTVAPRVVTATLPSGATERTETDTAGKTTKIIAKTAAATTIRSRSYAYLEGTSKRSLIQSVTDESNNKTAYTYKDTTINEDVGRLLKARTETSAGALVEQYAYSYDKAGNRTAKTRTTGTSATTSYAYNAANELCWSYSGTSSNTCATPPAGATSFTYDAYGNQLTGNHTITYEHLNRTASVDGSANFFDYLSPTQDDMFAFAGTRYVPTLLGVSHQSPFTNIIRNPTTGQAVAERRDIDKSWLLHDQLGSTIALLDGTASVVRSYAYTPDGQDTPTGTGPNTDIRYTGGVDIDDVKLYHFGARYYDPATARWTQPDPALHNTSLVQANRYSYANGNAINLTDPRGASLFDDAVDLLDEAGRAADKQLYCAGAFATLPAAGAIAGNAPGAAVGVVAAAGICGSLAVSTFLVENG